MFEYLSHSLARIDIDSPREAEDNLRLHVQKLRKLKKSDFLTCRSTNISLVEFLPGRPEWPGILKGEEGLNLRWSIHLPCTKKNLEQILPAVQNHPDKLEVRCSATWPQHRWFYLGHPLKSIHERIHEGFEISIDAQARKNHEAMRGMLADAFSATLSAWGVSGLIDTEGDECRFIESRRETANGNIFASNDLFKDRWADSLSYSKIHDFDSASELTLTTFDALSRHFGEPRLLQLDVESFIEEGEVCAEFCRSLAPNWRMVYYPVANKKYDPFNHPGHSEGTLVYPVAWNEYRANEVDMEDFMDIYTAVEHTPDGSSLLVASNHDEEWLSKVVADAGYGDHFEILGDESKFAEIKSVSKNIKKVCK